MATCRGWHVPRWDCQLLHKALGRRLSINSWCLGLVTLNYWKLKVVEIDHRICSLSFKYGKKWVIIFLDKVHIHYDAQSFQLHRLHGYESWSLIVFVSCLLRCQKVLSTGESTISQLPLSMPTVRRLAILVINMDCLPRSHCMVIGWSVGFPLPSTAAGYKRPRWWGICSGTEPSWRPAGFRRTNRKSFSISLKRFGLLNFGPNFGSIGKFSGSWMNQAHVDMLFL